MPMLKSLIRMMLLIAAGMVLIQPAVAKQPAPAPAHAHGVNWNATVTRTPDDGYMIGNPAAPLHLVAYISYTCPHCADFEAQAFAPLGLGMIGPGKGTYEIRPFLRNPIDMVATLAAECGPTSKFFGNTQLLLSTQTQWVLKVNSLTEAQKARWKDPNFGIRTRAVASDLGLYAIMERRGYTRGELDRCLSDEQHARHVAERTKEADEKGWVQGTPAFLINGDPLVATYNWESLKPQIDARLK